MSKQKNQKTRKWWLELLDMLLLFGGLLFLFAGHSFLLEWLVILLKGLFFSLFAVFVRIPDPKIITAESGQDVTLTCRAPNNNITAVEWSRADLEDKYVLLYRDGRLHRSNQHPSFKNRVHLQDRQMKDGDVSLILKDVTINDAGTYECRVVERGMNRRKRAILKTEPIHTVNLSVVPPGQRFMSRRILRVGDQKIITAGSGQDVTLTCRAPNNNIKVVEWNRADLGDKYVLVYRDGQFLPDEQHPSFKNRVDLQDRQMKDGDVSLILKNVRINDAGTYKCSVLTGTRSLELISIIYLFVVPRAQTAPSVGLIAVLSVSVVLLVAAVGFLIYGKKKLNPAGPHVAEHLQPEYPMIVTAESGQDVTLTCRAVNNESEKMNQQLHQPEVDPTQTETFLSV